MNASLALHGQPDVALAVGSGLGGQFVPRLRVGPEPGPGSELAAAGGQQLCSNEKGGDQSLANEKGGNGIALSLPPPPQNTEKVQKQVTASEQDGEEALKDQSLKVIHCVNEWLTEVRRTDGSLNEGDPFPPGSMYAALGTCTSFSALLDKYLDDGELSSLGSALQLWIAQVKMQKPNSTRPPGFEMEFTPDTLMTYCRIIFGKCRTEINKHNATNPNKHRAYFTATATNAPSAPDRHPAFDGFQTALDKKCKMLAAAGVGQKTGKWQMTGKSPTAPNRAASSIPGDLSELLWESTMFSMDNPEGLVRRMIFAISAMAKSGSVQTMRYLTMDCFSVETLTASGSGVEHSGMVGWSALVVDPCRLSAAKTAQPTKSTKASTLRRMVFALDPTWTDQTHRTHLTRHPLWLYSAYVAKRPQHLIDRKSNSAKQHPFFLMARAEKGLTIVQKKEIERDPVAGWWTVPVWYSAQAMGRNTLVTYLHDAVMELPMHALRGALGVEDTEVTLKEDLLNLCGFSTRQINVEYDPELRVASGRLKVPRGLLHCEGGGTSSDPRPAMQTLQTSSPLEMGVGMGVGMEMGMGVPPLGMQMPPGMHMGMFQQQQQQMMQMQQQQQHMMHAMHMHMQQMQHPQVAAGGADRPGPVVGAPGAADAAHEQGGN